MRVLIVEENTDLASLWSRHLERQGLVVDCTQTADQALDALCQTEYSVLVINLVLPSGGALGISDYARVKSPDTKVVLVTNDTFFRDGSLFGLVPNLRMTISQRTAPDDVAAIVSHFAEMS